MIIPIYNIKDEILKKIVLKVYIYKWEKKSQKKTFHLNK